MKIIKAERSQVTYQGTFSSPLFSLWGEGGKIFAGIYHALKPFNLLLSNLKNNSTSGDPADLEVSAHMMVEGSLTYYKFKFDRVELSQNDADKQSVLMIPEILNSNEMWMRAAIPDFSFSSHFFSFAGHFQFTEGSIRDYLMTLPTFQLKGIGVNTGNGIIFHHHLPEKNWSIQLTVDQSLVITGGLFVQYVIVIDEGDVNHAEILASGVGLLEEALAQLGLKIEDEQTEASS